ncbi:MAG: DUF2298 domain-containing protein [bacterium]|nr:DUF2298 domain-containing protein [bacterium]
MLNEWLIREGWIILNWWLLATLAGAAIFPLFTRLLRGLPDRGYTLARPAGILIVGFTFWLLSIFGFLSNTAGSILLAWLIVLAVSVTAYASVRGDDARRFDWRAWWHENRAAVTAAEIIFVVALVGWSIVRAAQNGILYTEKDMELAFISASMRSESFPPNDPWMAGYAISYYYFGYVIAAMFSLMSGINSTTGFNMATAMTFALTALGAFGVVYNLVRSRSFRFGIEYPAETRPGRAAGVLTGLLGVVIILLMGNWQALLIEIPYQTGTASTEYLRLFNSNERREANPAPVDSLEGMAQTGWWWFRSARVLNDVRINLDPNVYVREEVIDEFPAFSFVLADNHPHVLSLPFTLVAMALALNTLLSLKKPDSAQVIVYSLCLGGLIFLNTWDGPIYMVLLIAAEALRRYTRGGGVPLRTGDFVALAWLGVRILALSLVFYLPFLIGFRSQLGGILPNVQFPTLFTQFFTHFAPLLIILALYLIVESWRAGIRFNRSAGLIAAGVALGGLLMLMLVLVALASAIPALRGVVLDFIEANGGTETVVTLLIIKRLSHGITALVLAAGLVLVVGRLLPRLLPIPQEVEQPAAARAVITYPPATGFVLLLIGAGIMLTLIPEFVYLRDNFSTRMNTVFKFYYQAWVMWGAASAYALYVLLADTQGRQLNTGFRFLFGGAAAVAITGGLVFTIFAVYTRTVVEPGRHTFPEDDPALTLDGGSSFVRAGLVSADDFAAVECLSALVQGDDAVVVEAVGGSYGWGYGRVGTLTGIPVLYNWGGHQSQWRGATFGQIAGNKEADIEALYTDPTWNRARAILAQYRIDYVFFGTNERRKYDADETKFRDNLQIVCETGSTRVYQVDHTALN